MIHTVKRAVITEFLFLFWISVLGHGQIAVADPAETMPIKKMSCSEIDPVEPNLKLTINTRIRGSIMDQTGAPLSNSPIELRLFISQEKQVIVKKTSTDRKGSYDLGTVKLGQYRLLLSPNRMFKQPNKLECRQKKCTLDSVLFVNPNHQRARNCPIR